MSVELKPFQDYIHAIEKKLALGDATEHSHYPVLRELLESVGKEGRAGERAFPKAITAPLCCA